MEFIMRTLKTWSFICSWRGLIMTSPHGQIYLPRSMYSGQQRTCNDVNRGDCVVSRLAALCCIVLQHWLAVVWKVYCRNRTNDLRKSMICIAMSAEPWREHPGPYKGYYQKQRNGRLSINKDLIGTGIRIHKYGITKQHAAFHTLWYPDQRLALIFSISKAVATRRGMKRESTY